MTRILPFLAAAALCWALPARAVEALHYTLSFPDPASQYVEVRLDLDGVTDDTLRLAMASWTPGSYKIRDFAGQVPVLEAAARDGSREGRPLAVRKADKRTWLVATQGAGSLRVSYRVWCGEHSVRTPYVCPEHASLIPAGVFAYPEDHDPPARVTVRPAGGWTRVTCGLDRAPDDPWTFLAPDRDVLLDAPIEAGNHTLLSFTASGVRHDVALTGEHNADTARMRADLTAMVEACTDLFGGNPNTYYAFLVQNVPDNGYGGLEHLNSTSMLYGRWNYATPPGWRRFLGLASHEYLHLWNVKRVRPEGLGPFAYGHEVYTRFHWVTEGFTSYYDDLVLRRAGLIDEATYLDIAAGNLEGAFNRPGDAVQPVAEASFDAWIKYYQSNANSGNVTVSYYTKGAVLAMYLDLRFLAATKGKRRLDDVLRELYRRYQADPSRGYDEAEFRAIGERVSGLDLGDFFARHVHGTERPDLEAAFAGIGARLLDDGGEALKLGVRLDGNVVRSVSDGSPARAAGLMPDDELLAADGWRLDGDIGFHLGRHEAGDTLRLTLNRRGRLLEVDVPLFATRSHRYRIEADPGAGPREAALYRAWLHLPE